MRNIYLIFRRDYLGYVKAWGFWLGLAALPLFLLLGAGFGAYAAASSPLRYYAVVEPDRTFAEAIANTFAAYDAELADETEALAGELAPAAAEAIRETASANSPLRGFVEVPAPARTLEGLRPYLLGERLIDGPAGKRPLFAALMLSDDGRTLAYWSDDVNVTTLKETAEDAVKELARRNALAQLGLPPGFLKTAEQGAVSVTAYRLTTEDAEGGREVTLADRAPAIMAGALAYFLWLMIFSIIQYLLMGTLEERSNKIFDTLLTSVRVPQLLAGKLLAVFAVTSTMMLSWLVFGLAGSAFVASQAPQLMSTISPFLAPLTDPQLIIPGLISFVLGYVMYGAIFMALGSLCDTIQEAQTLLSPMMILLMLPMLAIFLAFQDPSTPVVSAAAWVPIFTPFLLILRMPLDPPLWEILVQMALMIITTAGIVRVSTEVYRAGAVHGAGVSDVGVMLKRAFGIKSKPKPAA